ncbi:MAG: hypothetical protein QOH46_2070 [Solirubrobacteraceae bacterium]|nr:hypothetical protein [Solirubrobacteraceae bacterium]
MTAQGRIRGVGIIAGDRYDGPRSGGRAGDPGARSREAGHGDRAPAIQGLSPGASSPVRRVRTEPSIAVVAEPALAERIVAALAADGLAVVAAVSSADDLAEACASTVPHVTTVGWEPDGAAALHTVMAAMPRTRAIVVVRRNLPGAVRDALRGGADGVVLTSDVAPTLPVVVRSVALGQASVPRERRMSLRSPALSPRESDVVRLAAHGLRAATIAEQLALAPSTVKRYLSSAYAKLGVKSRDELLGVVIDDENDDAPPGPARNGVP